MTPAAIFLLSFGSTLLLVCSYQLGRVAGWREAEEHTRREVEAACREMCETLGIDQQTEEV